MSFLLIPIECKNRSAVRACDYLCPNDVGYKIHLFQERLSYKSVKVYATMSKGIMGNPGQLLPDCSLRHLIMTEGKNTNMCIYAFLLETLFISVKDHKIFTTHNTNRHCCVRFYACLGQPLSKQLYTFLVRGVCLPITDHKIFSRELLFYPS